MNCIFCNKPLTEKQIVSNKRGIRRGLNKTGNCFCSQGCGASFRIKREAYDRKEDYLKNPRKCNFCYTDISYEKFVEKKTEKHNRNKPLEDIRMFCNQSCSAKYNNSGKNRHATIISNEINSLYELRNRMFFKDLLKSMGLNQCSLCAWNKASIEIHHINGRKIKDPHNHFNLTIVCPNCHSEIEAKLIPEDKLIRISDSVPQNWGDYIPEKYKKRG